MLRRSTFSGSLRALAAAVTVVVSLVPALAQDSAATLLVQVGQVSMLKDGNQIALSVGKSIQPNQIVLTGPGAYAKFQVADGSTFEVFEKSQVTFREKGGGFKELLNVYIGRVKVYIEHIFGPNPTSVTSPTALISVRGTVFDVVVENEDGDTLVSVDEGAVQVRHRLLPGNEPLLKPGDSITVFRNQPLLGQQINRGGGAQKVLAAARKALLDLIYMHPGGVGGVGAPAPGGAGSGGAQGDKGKNTGGAGKPPGGAPTPPAPPGGGGD